MHPQKWWLLLVNLYFFFFFFFSFSSFLYNKSLSIQTFICFDVLNKLDYGMDKRCKTLFHLTVRYKCLLIKCRDIFSGSTESNYTSFAGENVIFLVFEFRKKEETKKECRKGKFTIRLITIIKLDVFYFL